VPLHVLHDFCQEPIYGLEMIEELARDGYRFGPGTLYPLLHGRCNNCPESWCNADSQNARIGLVANFAHYHNVLAVALDLILSLAHRSPSYRQYTPILLCGCDDDLLFVETPPALLRHATLAVRPEKLRSRSSSSARGLLELGVFQFGLLEDRNVGVCVFPESEEITVGSASFGGVTLHRVGAT
jgi:hypothetical protein